MKIFNWRMKERARRNAIEGVRWLDENHPDWAQRVPETVDIIDYTHCIVPHLTGLDYHEGVYKLIGNNQDPISLGFFVPGDKKASRTIAEYAQLTMHFRTARANRLQAISMILDTQPDKPAHEKVESVTQ